MMYNLILLSLRKMFAIAISGASKTKNLLQILVA